MIRWRKEGAEYAPQIIFKTAAVILAAEQRLLRYNTCQRFLILRLDNSSWLLHLSGLAVMSAVKAGDFLSCKQLEWVLYLPGKENDPRPDTKLLLSAVIKASLAQNFKPNI